VEYVPEQMQRLGQHEAGLGREEVDDVVLVRRQDPVALFADVPEVVLHQVPQAWFACCVFLQEQAQHGSCQAGALEEVRRRLAAAVAGVSEEEIEGIGRLRDLLDGIQEMRGLSQHRLRLGRRAQSLKIAVGGLQLRKAKRARIEQALKLVGGQTKRI